MTTDSTYQIIEGSPHFVSTESNKLRSEGWELNGELLLVHISDRVVAFQGLTLHTTEK